MKIISTLICCVILIIGATVAFSQKPKVDLAKKIADATPPELPQEPIAKKAKTDAEDANLKGKVKSVVEYSLGARGNREVSEESYYSSSGFLVKTISYDEGLPNIVTVWGYIDGSRVTLSGEVTYAPGEKPPPKGISIMVRAEDNALNPNAPRDRRYTIKHIYKYDDRDRLVEEGMYQNNGEIWSRTTNTFDGNRRIERDFDNKGNEMSKTGYILDAAGNVVERDSYDEQDKISDRELKEYEFDSKGNWIVEKTYEPSKAKGSKARKLLWTSYRAITYYP